MKALTLYKLSARNIVRHPKTSLQIFSGIFFAAVVLMCIILYYLMLEDRLYKTSLNLKSANCLYTEITTTEQLDALENDEHIADMICSTQYFSYLDEDSAFMPFFSLLTLTINGETYQALRGEYLNADSFCRINVCASEGKTISYSEIEEYKYKFGDDMFLAGRDIQQKNEILISEEVFMLYRIPCTQWEDCIGKKITITAHSADGTNETINVLSDYVICGILNSDVARLCNRSEEDVFIIQSPLKELTKQYDSFTVYAHLNELYDLEQLSEQMTETYSLPFSYSDKNKEIKYITSQTELVRRVFFIAGAMISFSIVFNSIRILLYVTQQKKSFYGALLAMGMKRKYVRKMMFTEITLLSVLSLMLSCVLSIIAMHFFSSELSAFLSLEMELNTVILIQSFLLATAFHILVLLVSFLLAYRILKKREITELIR